VARSGGRGWWPLWEEVRGCPVLGTAGSTLKPLQATAEPISEIWGSSVKTFFKKGRKHQMGQGGNKKE